MAANVRHPELHDAEWLRRQYCERERSASQISVVIGCSTRAVYQALQDAEIELRGRRVGTFDELQSPEWLTDRYVNQKLSTYRIAEEIGCTPSAVIQALQRHQIQRRAKSPAMRIAARRHRGLLELGKREAGAREAKKLAKIQGGAISEAYSMAERMQGILAQAHREATDSEARRALSVAESNYRAMRDEIVRALGRL